MLIARTTKMRVDEAEALAAGSQCMANFDDAELHKVRGELMTDFPRYCAMTNRVSAVLGKPLVVMRQYEAAPGLWVLDDADTGVVILLWSDCHKKNAWKGTSIEAGVNDKNVSQISGAFRRLSVLLEY